MTAPGVVIRDTARDHHETADDYRRVIARLSDGCRVVICKDAHQWILQRRKGGGGEWPWRAVRFHRTRDALIRSTGALCGPCDAAAVAILAALPPNFAKRANGGAR